ncbi:sterol desaturase family protein [Massilia sp. YIM B02763]|uniref:sterol desaturase family protein n=1 Tax=Massilia sp. YIM B02763 TaxID=3050130 RepID=UPI0025B638BB|nr:sterol desaturase family protein [Massilia sp. YIM B02763]
MAFFFWSLVQHAMLFNAFVVVVTVVLMEVFSIVAHKYVMHGFGWGWHKSHHEPRTGWFEKNDLYAFVFAGVAILLIWLGTEGRHPLEWIGAGMTAYGLLYFVAHDGLVHQRWPFRYVPRRGYLKRLYQAHRMHHAVQGKEGTVSFGFLYAPPVDKLKRQLHALHGGAPQRRPDGATGRERAAAHAERAK